MKCLDCCESDRIVFCKGLCRRCYQRAAAEKRPWRPCQCGCGGQTQGVGGFISGHNTRLLAPEEQGRRGRQGNGVERPNGGNWYRKVNYQHEHRAVAEKMLGRKLLKSEIVHHRNENKRDNRPENLEVMSRKQHMILHIHSKRRSLK